MKLLNTFFALGLCCAFNLTAGEVLVVADEFPAMQTLGARLKEYEGINTKIVKQTEMPASLSGFQAVVVYIHGKLLADAERAMVHYTTNGGRLVCLHHSISSGKKTNEQWFAFLGVDLSKKDVEAGGYKWIEGVNMDIVKLPQDDFVTTHKIKFEQQCEYVSSETKAAMQAPRFHLEDTEVYINHVLKEPRTLLLGFKYTDAKTGKTWMQDTAGWYKPAGKGKIYYFMPGHSVREFENAIYTRMVANAIIQAK